MLKDVNWFLDLKFKWDRVRTLDYELYAVSSSAYAGRDWHSNVNKCTRKENLQSQTKTTKEAFEFGGGEVVNSSRPFTYAIMLNGHLARESVFRSSVRAVSRIEVPRPET